MWRHSDVILLMTHFPPKKCWCKQFIYQISDDATWRHEVGWRIFVFWLNFLIGISLLSKYQAHWISFGQDMLWSIFADSIGVADFANLVWQNQHNLSPDHQNSTKSLETSKTKLNLGNVHILCQQYFLIFWPPPPSCQHMSATGYPPPLHWHPDYHRWPLPPFPNKFTKC